MNVRNWLTLSLLLGSWFLLASCARKSTRELSSAESTVPHAAGPERGAAVYHNQCARCHGAKGEGVADKYDEPLYGDRSLESLARLIERTMPEDKPGTCVGPDAQSVAQFIFDSFYSPQARARNHPARRDLVRLTNRQYRESIADLIASFHARHQPLTRGELSAEYYQSKGMNKKDKRVLDRHDSRIDFDFADAAPAEGITPDQFSIAWTGSLFARDSGGYEFRLTTPNGARLYLNTELAAGDSNKRDDSDAKRQPALIDLWVSSGSMPREAVAQLHLLGGRTYPLRLDFFKFKEKTAAVKLEWKPPHGVWSIIPSEVLSPKPSSSTVSIATSLPPDDGSQGYERGTIVSKAWHEATTKAAIEATAHIEARIDQLSQSQEGGSNRVEQLKAFSTAFAERAFRRPLSAEMKASMIDALFASAPTPEVAVKRTVLFVLKSPRFLYPGLAGDSDDYSVAGRLALALWDSIPDDVLTAAAAKGELHTSGQIRAQAARMVADARAKAKLQTFFNHWLAIEEAEDITKDPKTYPDFSPELLADLRLSLEKFVDHVVWSDSSDYRELLLADYLFLNPRLAKFYGTSLPPGEEFQPVKFNASERAGIFTHPFLLSAFSYHKSTSPIHRGVFLTRNVLGRFLKPPPMAIEFMDDRFDPSLTMREKVTQLTSKEACMACHATINPLGFSLEHYDAVGRYRTVDNAKPVDATANYVAADGTKVPLKGARDLAEHAATSAEARQGFVRQLFQQIVKQPAITYGPDVLKRLDAIFVKSDYRVRDLLVEIAVTCSISASNRQLALHP